MKTTHDDDDDDDDNDNNKITNEQLQISVNHIISMVELLSQWAYEMIAFSFSCELLFVCLFIFFLFYFLALVQNMDFQQINRINTFESNNTPFCE